jgi:hypothetical protein
MGRWIGRALAVLSLALATLALALWAVDRHSMSTAGWVNHSGAAWLISSIRGQIVFEHIETGPRFWPKQEPWDAGARWYRTTIESEDYWRRWTQNYSSQDVIDHASFTFARGTYFYDAYEHGMLALHIGQGTGLGTPDWFVGLCFAAYPVLSLSRSLRRRNRLRQGCCVRCGYDLRASCGRCPECGIESCAATAGESRLNLI